MAGTTRPTPTWPFLLVLGCLFVLSVLAPRNWRGDGHQGDSLTASAHTAMQGHPIVPTSAPSPLKTPKYPSTRRVAELGGAARIADPESTPMLPSPSQFSVASEDEGPGGGNQNGENGVNRALASSSASSVSRLPSVVVMAADDGPNRPSTFGSGTNDVSDPDAGAPMSAIDVTAQAYPAITAPPGPTLTPPAPAFADRVGVTESDEFAGDEVHSPSAQTDTPLPAMPETMAGPDVPSAELSLNGPDGASVDSTPADAGLEPPRPSGDGDAGAASQGEGAAAAEQEGSENEQDESAWPRPRLLLEGLEALRGMPPAADWAAEVEPLVCRAVEAMAAPRADVETILARLESLQRQGERAALTLDDRSVGRQWARTAYALRRRLDIWRAVLALRPIKTAAGAEDEAAGLVVCLAAVESALPHSAEGVAWREYLLLDELASRAAEARSGRSASPDAIPVDLVEEVLRRLYDVPLSLAQREFLSRPPLAALGARLRRLAGRTIDAATLLDAMESYEAMRRADDAQRLAWDRRRLSYLSEASPRELAAWLDAHYRNANVRVAVSEELLNRLVPKQPPEVAPVRDTILGRPVRGRSVSSAELRVRMLPDPKRVRLALEVSGLVSSLTSSTAGPATFYNNSRAVYVARKPLEIDLRGIRAWPAEAEVYNNSRLRDLETQFDGLPLFGPIAQEIARSQHDLNLPAANREIQAKIAARAKQRIDQQTEEQLSAATERFHRHVLVPIHEMSLDPTLIDAQTDARRFSMRVRLAGEDQLGAHTPRPQAPVDSLASLQLHETAINNALQRLELDGRTFTLAELARHVSTRLSRLEPWETAEENEDVTITFADSNAVEVRCDDGRMVLTFSIAKLSKPPRSFRDFQVRAFYVPVARGRAAELSRDGVIHLIGDRLNTGSQIVLRGVFSRTFSRKTPWTLTPQRIIESEQLADTEITQFVIEDGWIGVALGPKRSVSTARPAADRRY